MRGVQLGTELDAAELTGDPAGLQRVLSNLVANAVRHTPSDGTVLVTTSTMGSDVVLSVSDGCGGMSAEELERAFGPGWRGTRGRAPRNDGGGCLGLAITSGIVAMHPGRIAVHNTTLGCCFEVRIPVSGARQRRSLSSPSWHASSGQHLPCHKGDDIVCRKVHDGGNKWT